MRNDAIRSADRRHAGSRMTPSSPCRCLHRQWAATPPLQSAPTPGSAATSTRMVFSRVLVCDPRKGLLKGQYFNPNCFAAPLPPTATSFGQNGSDHLALHPHAALLWQRSWRSSRHSESTDAQRVEVRISATNWLNHPNAQFGLAGNSDNQLVVQWCSAAGSALTYNSQTAHHRYPAEQGWISLDAVRSQVLLLIQFRSMQQEGVASMPPLLFLPPESLRIVVVFDSQLRTQYAPDLQA